MIRLSLSDGSCAWINAASVVSVEPFHDPEHGICTRIRLPDDLCFVMKGDCADIVSGQINVILYRMASLLHF